MRHHPPSSKLLTLAGVMILAATLQAHPERPKPDLLFIENSAMKVGIDRSMGASVTWLSWTAHPPNIINGPHRLHAPRQTTVEVVYGGGKIEKLVVFPPERRKNVQLPTGIDAP